MEPYSSLRVFDVDQEITPNARIGSYRNYVHHDTPLGAPGTQKHKVPALLRPYIFFNGPLSKDRRGNAQ